MPVRIRITLLFAALVFIILGLVCSSIYYFSHVSRIDTIRRRLNNRAITTARLLSQSEIFDRELVARIDSSTTLSFKNKSVEAFNYQNEQVYHYSDVPGDTIGIDKSLLDDARIGGDIYFTDGEKDAVAYHYADDNYRVVVVAAAEDVEGKRALRSLAQILVLSFLGGLVIACTGGYFFSKGLLMPVKKIADTVNEITTRNFTRRVPTGPARDEWRYLADTLNNLLDRLQESFDTQKRFIANASHELSTPLTSISSQLEVSLQRHREAEEYKAVMQSILQDVRQMSRLTQALLHFAKASGDPGGLPIEPLRIDEIVMRLPAEAARLDRRYSVTLNFAELPEDEERLLVYGNEELLVTALRNIVVNACKYSDDHHALVSLAVTAGGCNISIRDEGVGIPAEELEHIFQPFYRVDESRTTEGFGLGLSLAHRIIKLHKGTVTVASAVGKGTDFLIRLPTN